MLDKILNNLHPAINKDPQASPALRLTGSGTVIIGNNIIQIIGDHPAQFDLRGYTLSALTTAIDNLDGVTASCLALGELSALVLLPGTYNLPVTIPVFTSFLWQLLKPVALALVDALGAQGRLLFEMIQNTADGSWLDSFGELFGVTRQTDEPDSLYASRIFSLSVGVRVNNVAIQKTLKDIQYDSEVVDSGATTFTVNLQIPSSPPDGFIYRTEQLRNVIDEIRPAGIQYEILSQGSENDDITVMEEVVVIKVTGRIKYGSSRKWGQMVWG